MADKFISIKYFQPSWFQIKAENRVIYIDPAYLKKYYIKYLKKIDYTSWPDPIDGLPEKDLEKADIILITHYHKDHCKAVTVNRLKKSNTIVIAPEICCKELGKNIKTIKPGEKLKVGKIEVEATFAYNTKEGSSTKKIHKKGECVGYLIKINGKIIYHAGDTDFIPEMKEFGKIDIALLPIGGIFTMNIPEATEASIAIKPKVVIPMHNLKADPQEFKKRLEVKSKIKVILLKIGEIYHLE